MLRVKHVVLVAGALIWAGACAAQVTIVPGEWRMSTHTAAGDLHYSACLKSRHITAQILRQEGQHCQMEGPIVVQGTVVTITEDCQMAPPGSQGAVNVKVVARLRVQAGGLRFAGSSHLVIATALGDITEHQRITGVHTGVCASH
ncbi:MAG: hypothetical protein ACYDEV_16175 [Acidiferrobacter sp.]